MHGIRRTKVCASLNKELLTLECHLHCYSSNTKEITGVSSYGHKIDTSKCGCSEKIKTMFIHNLTLGCK